MFFAFGEWKNKEVSEKQRGKGGVPIFWKEGRNYYFQHFCGRIKQSCQENSPCKSHFLHNQRVSERESEGHEKRDTESDIEREERETRAPQQ